MTDMHKEPIGFPRLQKLDRALEGRLPEAIRDGAHLITVYAGGHPERRFRELSVFRLLRDRTDLPLSTDTILEIYGTLTRGTELEGKGWKSSNSYLTFNDGFYITTPAEETPQAMEDLCEKYRHLNDAGRLQSDPDAFDDIFRFLLEFICIHPFLDGNGRMSVFLLLLLLKNAGLKHAVFIPQDFVQNLRGRELLHLHILKASGVFYGQKPLEYDPYISFMKGTVKESYEILAQAVAELEEGE